MGRTTRSRGILRLPLVRLLAINLAIGIAMAFLMIGGLLALNPYRLRDLILSDHASGLSLALLIFGFTVTFGSTVMGTAIMALGEDTRARRAPKTPEMTGEPVRVKASTR